METENTKHDENLKQTVTIHNYGVNKRQYSYDTDIQFNKFDIHTVAKILHMVVPGLINKKYAAVTIDANNSNSEAMPLLYDKSASRHIFASLFHKWKDFNNLNSNLDWAFRKAFRILLKCGNPDKHSLLHMAVEYCYVDAGHALLDLASEFNLNMNVSTLIIGINSFLDENPKHSSLILRIIDRLDDIMDEMHDFKTALHLAVQKRCLVILQKLLSRVNDDGTGLRVTIVNKYGNTAEDLIKCNDNLTLEAFNSMHNRVAKYKTLVKYAIRETLSNTLIPDLCILIVSYIEFIDTKKN